MSSVVIMSKIRIMSSVVINNEWDTIYKRENIYIQNNRIIE